MPPSPTPIRQLSARARVWGGGGPESIPSPPGTPIAFSTILDRSDLAKLGNSMRGASLDRFYLGGAEQVGPSFEWRASESWGDEVPRRLVLS